MARKPPPPPNGSLSDEDADLWAEVMRDARALDPAARRRAADVVRPTAAPEPEATVPATPPDAKPRNTKSTPAPPAPRGRPAPPSPGVGTDRRTQVRLRRGQVEIDARIDLHGRTQHEARAALEAFLSNSTARRHRCVLVITGKGASRRDDEAGFMPDRDRGVLREQVPRWLALPPLAQHVVTWQPAARQHGGTGALYVLVRRKK
ncbi:MAG: Smr/MutS family protein [Alphaproteobacteria bacterium]